jgi:hypothetical protein
MERPPAGIALVIGPVEWSNRRAARLVLKSAKPDSSAAPSKTV